MCASIRHNNNGPISFFHSLMDYICMYARMHVCACVGKCVKEQMRLSIQLYACVCVWVCVTVCVRIVQVYIVCSCVDESYRIA